MTFLQPLGKRLIFWGALILAAWAGYELYIRLDAMAIPLGMFFSMWKGENIPFHRAITYVDWRVLDIPLYLSLCVVAGVWGLLLRNRKITPWFMLLASVALAVWGQGVQSLLLPSLWEMVKLLPLLLMFLGALCTIIGQISLRRRRIQPPADGRDTYFRHQR